ncbi:MAG: hypothetical protein E6J70_02595 [Deltaproteobacteria bacterium]|nr:MAG: hypothetical protein E6J70_02595 [Deltaproteobacteria bacterium]
MRPHERRPRQRGAGGRPRPSPGGASRVRALRARVGAGGGGRTAALSPGARCAPRGPPRPPCASRASNYLPGRNLLLGSLAAVHCARARIPALALALLGDNPFPDATPDFLRTFGRCATRALGAPIRVRAPFRRLGKDAVIRLGHDLPLGLTLSCARPRGLRHCGRCTKCAERRAAFARAGVADPTTYAGGRRGA